MLRVNVLGLATGFCAVPSTSNSPVDSEHVLGRLQVVWRCPAALPMLVTPHPRHKLCLQKNNFRELVKTLWGSEKYQPPNINHIADFHKSLLKEKFWILIKQSTSLQAVADYIF